MAASAPTTLHEFVDLVQKSRLVDRTKFDEYRRALQRSGMPDRPHRLARRMVADGLLTNFQAEQLLKGKHKGFSLGNYRILERVGRGGMGTVYLAEHRVMRHRVAIKVLPPEAAENPTTLDRFHREARAAATLNHPNIVRAFDIDCCHGMPYLVMEYVEGVTLHELVARNGPLGIDRATNYIVQAAAALHYAHETAGMVHRDIKPSNLLVDRSGTVKILDMGLARLGLSALFDREADSITRNYNDKSILGTADYIAPEQAVDSQGVDIRADIYSLGATFHHLLTGSPPFPGGTTTQKLMRHQLEQPVPLRRIRPEVPEEIDDLVSRMLRKKPEERPRDPSEVLEALAPWLACEPLPPGDEEIPTLCPAAQGPSSNPSSMASINLGARLSRAGSMSNISLSSVSLGSGTGSPAKGGSETPVDASPSELHHALDAAARRPDPPEQPASKRRTLHRVLALAVAAALGALGGAILCLSALAR